MVLDNRGEVLSRIDGVAISFFPADQSFPERWVVNNFVAIPIHSVRKYAAESEFYDIPVSRNGSEVGAICLLSQVSNAPDRFASLTDYQYAAYLSLAPISAITSKSWVSLSYDAFVIKKDQFADYWLNKQSSMLWGGFLPIDDTNVSNLGRVKSSVANVEMCLEGSARTVRHKECLELGTLSNHLAERFLHLYHYLELDYDYEIVKQVKNIDENDPRGFWDVFKHQQSDMDRLYHVLKNYPEIQKIEKIIQHQLKPHAAAARRIFYEYGKDSNPLQSEDAFVLQFLDPIIISQTEMNTIKGLKSLTDNFAAKQATYEVKLRKLVCYWIYRFRCSIAHNKLGDYYLNQTDDMEFLAAFGEPLLCELIRFRMSM